MRVLFPEVSFRVRDDTAFGELCEVELWIQDPRTNDTVFCGTTSLKVAEAVRKGEELMAHPSGLVWVKKL
jgi:hypothetical protein